MPKQKKPPRSKCPMHKRKLQGIAIRRKILVKAMGGQCEDCGCEGTPRNKLEFHHTSPRTWVCRDKSRWSRQRLYEEEWDKGLLILLCAFCNKARGQPVEEASEGEVPF
ncbi:hypothetical protein SH661x_002296 [Planctomicrobium sp. SH661]|uniref:hypothetical protein n=1 Tax=Planctomicrobium sp. SH661 TaxID=3448124 RepID=UPI003F5C659C